MNLNLEVSDSLKYKAWLETVVLFNASEFRFKKIEGWSAWPLEGGNLMFEKTLDDLRRVCPLLGIEKFIAYPRPGTPNLEMYELELAGDDFHVLTRQEDHLGQCFFIYDTFLFDPDFQFACYLGFKDEFSVFFGPQWFLESLMRRPIEQGFKEFQEYQEYMGSSKTSSFFITSMKYGHFLEYIHKATTAYNNEPLADSFEFESINPC